MNISQKIRVSFFAILFAAGISACSSTERRAEGEAEPTVTTTNTTTTTTTEQPDIAGLDRDVEETIVPATTDRINLGAASTGRSR